MHITREQLDRLRLGALTAIDGLWFLALEERYGFDEALNMDLEVWKSYGVILLKRMARMVNVPLASGEAPGLPAVKFFLETISRVDGTEYTSEIRGDGTLEFRVRRCSWWENLKKAGREKTVPCEMIDNTIFGHWLKAIDPSLEMEFTRSLPRGDDHCAWVIRRAGKK